jgi:hypothetical protein
LPQKHNVKESIPGTDEHSLTHPTRPSGLGGVKQAIKEHLPGTDAHRHRNQDVGENAKELVPGKPMLNKYIRSCSFGIISVFLRRLENILAISPVYCFAFSSNVLLLLSRLKMFPVFLAGTTNNQKATESTGEQVKRHIPGTKEHHTANEGVGEKVKPCLTLQFLLYCI